MRLAEVLGLPWDENFEPDSAEMGRLVSNLIGGYQDFLRANGRVTLDEWQGFSAIEKEAASRAGDRIRAIVATITGLSAQGHHAMIYSEVDDGDALIEKHLSSVLDSMEEKGLNP